MQRYDILLDKLFCPNILSILSKVNVNKHDVLHKWAISSEYQAQYLCICGLTTCHNIRHQNLRKTSQLSMHALAIGCTTLCAIRPDLWTCAWTVTTAKSTASPSCFGDMALYPRACARVRRSVPLFCWLSCVSPCFINALTLTNDFP